MRLLALLGCALIGSSQAAAMLAGDAAPITGYQMLAGFFEKETSRRFGELRLRSSGDGEVLISLITANLDGTRDCAVSARGTMGANGQAIMTPLENADPRARFRLIAISSSELRLEPLGADWDLTCTLGRPWGRYRAPASRP